MKGIEIRLPIFLSLFLILVLFNPLYAGTETLQTKEVIIFFEGPLRQIAKEVEKIYPDIKSELVWTLKWEVDFRPEIILVKDRDAFRKMTESNIVVAFAVPDKNLIVLDTSRVYVKPFTLGSTLKHELCHILLHRNIESKNLPRWLDEGVCQWASGGIAEIILDSGEGTLAKAAVSDSMISIRNLTRFPDDEKSLILAYEESKSIVEYIVSEYREQGVLQVLEYLKQGYSADDSISKGLLVSTSELENKWIAHLKRRYSWFSYVSQHIYTILFFLAALATVYGFIRLLKKKRAYVDEEEDGKSF
ncbi:MAG: hypothetical protein A2Z47_12670 [Thermodesulfovibrio sp. RBG_19FT_COMBO_42_12]|nr:MAG: hypothetical protein A2Z47_12670 [Thermodesulfovibrio sp. RBG_19FT_COMBO_42_12]